MSFEEVHTGRAEGAIAVEQQDWVHVINGTRDDQGPRDRNRTPPLTNEPRSVARIDSCPPPVREPSWVSSPRQNAPPLLSGARMRRRMTEAMDNQPDLACSMLLARLRAHRLRQQAPLDPTSTPGQLAA